MSTKDFMIHDYNNDKLKITLGTHFFKVSNLKERHIGLLLKFSSRYITYGFVRQDNKMVRKPSKVFANRTIDGKEYRFHIGQYEDFIKHLEYNFVFSDQFEVIQLPEYVPEKIKTELNPKFQLRDYQTDCVDFLLDDDFTDNQSRLVSLATGLGKTLIASAAMAKIGKRVAIAILPQYMEKWASDISKNLIVKPKDIMLVQGSDQLRGIIALGLENILKANFIIISLTTYQNFIKAYEDDPDAVVLSYGCKPEEFFSIIRAGVLTIDETHQHIHAVYKLLCHTNGPKVIGLSGTLISDDPTIDKIHRTIFPKEIRFDKMAMSKYIKVRAVSYSFRNIREAKIRTTNFGTNVYSHVEFEKSIMRNKGVLNNYLNLLDMLFVNGYVNDYIKGDKALIYAATIKFCDVLLSFFKKKYGNRFDIRRYVEQDPYENVIDSDVRISTIQSCGTAIDIPDLRMVLMTINIQSPVANLQSLGRLRELKDRDVKFYYCYCNDIPKHIDYHRKRMELYSDRAASIKELSSNIAI